MKEMTTNSVRFQQIKFFHTLLKLSMYATEHIKLYGQFYSHNHRKSEINSNVQPQNQWLRIREPSPVVKSYATKGFQ